MTNAEKELKSKGEETKEKLLEVATELFANQGFEGASIRELARLADVNLGAVNYHFSNKQNLYHEVLKAGFLHFNSQVRKLSEEKERNTEELAIALYLVLSNNGPRLMNQFKMILMDEPVPENVCSTSQASGPPGAEYLSMAIAKDTKKVISPDDSMWAVRVIFTFVVHNALMASSYFGRHHKEKLFSTEKMKPAISRLVKSVLSELNSK